MIATTLVTWTYPERETALGLSMTLRVVIFYDLGRLIYCGYWHRDRFHNRGKLYFYDLPKKPYLALESFKDYHYVKNNRLSYTGQFVMGEMKGLG